MNDSTHIVIALWIEIEGREGGGVSLKMNCRLLDICKKNREDGLIWGVLLDTEFRTPNFKN